MRKIAPFDAGVVFLALRQPGSRRAAAIESVGASSGSRISTGRWQRGFEMAEAKTIVENFLRTMERRDLAGARRFLAPDFVMIFPGGRRFGALEDMVAWSQTRGRGVHKVFDRLDEVKSSDETVVYCFGTLQGQWADGTPFAGIRYLDRFALRGGLIVEQRVWNDMGEHRPMAPAPTQG